MDNYSLADIRAATQNDGMNGGDSWWIIILFLALFNGGGNLGNNRGNAATTEDLASGFNFNSLQGKANDILTAVNNVNQVIGNAICNLGYQNAQQSYELSRQIAECCCGTQRAVDGVRFDMANYSAGIQAAITAGTQKVLDKMCEDKQAAMAQRIQQLELQQAMCGVPRINPYGYGIYPTMAAVNPCGCQNI